MKTKYSVALFAVLGVAASVVANQGRGGPGVVNWEITSPAPAQPDDTEILETANIAISGWAANDKDMNYTVSVTKNNVAEQTGSGKSTTADPPTFGTTLSPSAGTWPLGFCFANVDPVNGLGDSNRFKVIAVP
jgi:hypothetical protein